MNGSETYQDAEIVNGALATIERAIGVLGPNGPQTALRYLAEKQSRVSADGTFSQRTEVIDVRNGDWLFSNGAPLRIIPALWPEVLAGHGKMMTLAFNLATRANSIGQISKLHIEKLAEELGYTTTQTFAFITNLVGLGLVTILNPRARNKKLYLNLQLHAIPIGLESLVNQPVVMTPQPADEERLEVVQAEIVEEPAA